MAGIRWLPLESNPDVINKYIQNLGVAEDYKFVDVYDLTEDGLKSVPRPVLALMLLYPKAAQYVAALGMSTDKWQFTDIYGLDPELLMMVPRPVAAVMLLYPITEKSESEPLGTKIAPEDSLYFMKQTIGNACGTIGLLHAIINNRQQLEISGDAHFGKFYEATKEMSPSERAVYMETDQALGAAHEESANEGQTAAPSREDKTNFHFICFIHKDGGLYELDGRKEGPVQHGKTTNDTLLEDACTIVKKFMERDPENLNFTMVALSKA